MTGLETLVEKNKTDLPGLFDADAGVQVSRAQLQAILELIKTAQMPDGINEQITALQRLQKTIEKLLK